MLSAAENPSVTFPADACVAGMKGTWWVAHTKARQEKAFAHDLACKGISYFLPLMEQVRVIRGRKFRPLIPLFPSYVFVCGSDDDRLASFRGNRLAGTIAVPDQATLVRELAQIQKALDAGAPMAPCAFARKGRRCRVVSGPFMGVEGIIARDGGSTRLVLAIESLGQAVHLEIEAGLLEPVD